MGMNVSVYLGSSMHCRREYNDLAREVGRRLALAGHTIVYGGADVGTMKDLADGAQQEGGNIIGVFPKFFRGTLEVQRRGVKVTRDGLTEMIIVKDFAERKAKMEELSDCCLILPGSYGTLDELFTFACNYSIGLHSKKIYILNHKGFYSPIKELISNTLEAGFLKEETFDVITFCDTVEDFLKIITSI